MVFLCYTGGDRKTMELIKWGKKDEQFMVNADRDRMIQLVVGEFRTKRLPVHGNENDWYEYYMDWNNLYRIKVLDPETNVVKGHKWVRKGRDHKCFVAGTKILTSIGEKNIEKITVGDKVLTRKGFRKVVWTKNYMADVIDTGVLKGTKDHPIWTENCGYKDLLAMVYSDILLVCKPKKLLIRALSFIDILNQKIEQIESILFVRQGKGTRHLRGHTSKFIRTILAIFQKVLLYITKIIIPLIIHQITWRQYTQPNTQNYTQKSGTQKKKIRIVFYDILRRYAPYRLKHLRNTKKLRKVRLCLAEMLHYLTQRVLYVLNVEQNLQPSHAMGGHTAQSVATQGLMQESGERNIPIIGSVTKEKVYNFEVEDAHEYFANGVLVSNCLATVYWRIGISRFSSGGTITMPTEEVKPNSYMLNPDGSVDFDPKKMFDFEDEQEEDDWRIIS